MSDKCTRCHRFFISGEARCAGNTHASCEARPVPVVAPVVGALSRLGAGFVSKHKDHGCTDAALLGAAEDCVREASEGVLAAHALFSEPRVGRIMDVAGRSASSVAALAASREKISLCAARLDAAEYSAPAFDSLRSSVGLALSCVDCIITGNVPSSDDSDIRVFYSLCGFMKAVMTLVSECREAGEGCAVAFSAAEMVRKTVPLFQSIHAAVGSPRFPFQNEGHFTVMLMMCAH